MTATAEQEYTLNEGEAPWDWSKPISDSREWDRAIAVIDTAYRNARVKTHGLFERAHNRVLPNMTPCWENPEWQGLGSHTQGDGAIPAPGKIKAAASVLVAALEAGSARFAAAYGLPKPPQRRPGRWVTLDPDRDRAADAVLGELTEDDERRAHDSEVPPPPAANTPGEVENIERYFGDGTTDTPSPDRNPPSELGAQDNTEDEGADSDGTQALDWVPGFGDGDALPDGGLGVFGE